MAGGVCSVAFKRPQKEQPARLCVFKTVRIRYSSFSLSVFLLHKTLVIVNVEVNWELVKLSCLTVCYSFYYTTPQAVHM